jgi:hypothetical protein
VETLRVEAMWFQRSVAVVLAEADSERRGIAREMSQAAGRNQSMLHR